MRKEEGGDPYFRRRFKKKFNQGGRIGLAGGSIVKGGKWMIKNLRQAYDELIEGKAFTHLPEKMGKRRIKVGNFSPNETEDY